MIPYACICQLTRQPAGRTNSAKSKRSATSNLKRATSEDIISSKEKPKRSETRKFSKSQKRLDEKQVHHLYGSKDVGRLLAIRMRFIRSPSEIFSKIQKSSSRLLDFQQKTSFGLHMQVFFLSCQTKNKFRLDRRMILSWNAQAALRKWKKKRKRKKRLGLWKNKTLFQL